MWLVICSYGVGNSLRAGESLEVDIEPVEDVGGRLFLHHPRPPVDCGLRISTGSSIRCSLFNKQIALIYWETVLTPPLATCRLWIADFNRFEHQVFSFQHGDSTY